MARSTWGVNTNDLRRTYIATVLPQFLYCVSVWFVPSGGHGFKGKELRTLSLMKRIQSRAGNIISGAFRTSAGVALEVELFLRPINLQLDIFLDDALLRIITSPAYKYIISTRTVQSYPPHSKILQPQQRHQFTRLNPLQKLELRFAAV